MLDGTTDACGNVKLGCDDLAGLTHLQIVGRITGVHCRATGTNGGTQLVGQRGHDLNELLLRAQCTTTTDDDLGGGEFRAVVLGDLCAQVSGCRGYS